MSLRAVNYWNIGLMAAALGAAFLLPFELFLCAYAVLGPLHYLTQIGWLHTRGYYTKGSKDYWILAGLTLAIFLAAYVGTGQEELEATLICVAFGAALVMAFVEDRTARAALFVGVVVVSVLLQGWEHYTLLFAMLLPTMVHVCLFTGAFLLYGALKSRSPSGHASFAFYLACIAAIFLVVPDPAGYQVGAGVRASYASFQALSNDLARTLGFGSFAFLEDVYESRTGQTVARLIAFCYTYHYLNWFSKTSVIRWHRVPKRWLLASFAIWIAALALYAYDYAVGLVALFYLSFLHVVLEFPLDHLALTGIGRELARAVPFRRGAGAAPAAAARMPRGR